MLYITVDLSFGQESASPNAFIVSKYSNGADVDEVEEPVTHYGIPNVTDA
jgi:hypothetical protein